MSRFCMEVLSFPRTQRPALQQSSRVSLGEREQRYVSMICPRRALLSDLHPTHILGVTVRGEGGVKGEREVWSDK